MRIDRKERIKIATTLFLIIMGFMITIIIMLKYNIEGEKNMPFKLSEIIVISSGEGQAKKENPENYRWNLNLIQYNDIYLHIANNEEYKKNSFIESISIENFKFDNPKVGSVRLYMPCSTEKSLFSMEDNYLINRKLTFNGADVTNTKTLQINNQGGNLVFRVANLDIGEFVSNEDEELSYNGTILSKTGVSIEDLKFDLLFDIVIKTNINSYRGSVRLELPCGDILTEGTSHLDKKDCTDIIFRRENY